MTRDLNDLGDRRKAHRAIHKEPVGKSTAHHVIDGGN
jgi:hypothetical protein